VFSFRKFSGQFKKVGTQTIKSNSSNFATDRRKESTEKTSLLEKKQQCQMQHFEGPLPSGYESYSQFKQYRSSNLFLSLLPEDNCVCIDESVCVIKNIISSCDSTNIVFSKFANKESFSTYPFDLQLININKVAGLKDELCVAELHSIQYKCVLLPHQTEVDCYVVMPLLHNV